MMMMMVMMIPANESAAMRTSHSFISVSWRLHGRSTLVAVYRRQHGVLIREVIGDRVDRHVDAGSHVHQSRLQPTQGRVRRRRHGARHRDQPFQTGSKCRQLLNKVAGSGELDGARLCEGRCGSRPASVSTQLSHHLTYSSRYVADAA